MRWKLHVFVLNLWIRRGCCFMRGGGPALNSLSANGCSFSDIDSCRSNGIANDRAHKLYSATGFNIETLKHDFGGNGGGAMIHSEGFNGDDRFDESFIFSFGNTTLASERNVAHHETPLAVKKSPVLKFFYCLFLSTYRRVVIYGVMALCIVDSIKKHILPIYLVSSFIQCLKPQWSTKFLTSVTRTFLFLSLSSFLIQSVRSKVSILRSPLLRDNQNEKGNPSKKSLPYAVIVDALTKNGNCTAAELASRGWNMILIGSDISKLNEMGKKLQVDGRSRGTVIEVKPVVVNFTDEHYSDTIYNFITTQTKIDPEILVVTSDDNYENYLPLEGSESSSIRALSGTYSSKANLISNFARIMKERRTGRIMLFSNSFGKMRTTVSPLRSGFESFFETFAESLSFELEKYGVCVTYVFANPSSIKNTSVNKLLIDERRHAREAVDKMLKGDSVVVPGFANKFIVHTLMPVLPHRVRMSMVQYFYSNAADESSS